MLICAWLHAEKTFQMRLQFQLTCEIRPSIKSMYDYRNEDLGRSIINNKRQNTYRWGRVTNLDARLSFTKRILAGCNQYKKQRRKTFSTKQQLFISPLANQSILAQKYVPSKWALDKSCAWTMRVFVCMLYGNWPRAGRKKETFVYRLSCIPVTMRVFVCCLWTFCKFA